MALRASAMISLAERDDRADRHLAGVGGLGGKVERAAHRRRKRKAPCAAALARSAARLSATWQLAVSLVAAWSVGSRPG